MKIKVPITKQEFDETLKKSVDYIKKNKKVLNIILFGSYARNDHSLNHSDIDLYILMDYKKRDFKIEREMWRFVNSIGYNIQVHLSFEYQNILKEGSLLRYNILKDGIILYEKKKGIFLKNDFDLEEVYYIKLDLKDLEPYQKTNFKRSMLTRYKNNVLDYMGNIVIIKKYFLLKFKKLTQQKNINFEIKYEFLFRNKQEYDDF